MTKPSPYDSMMSAAKNQYHGISSVNKFGAIQHGHMIAKILKDRGDAETELDALVQATNMLQQLEAVSKGVLLHKEAHLQLQAEKREARRTDTETGGLHPSALGLGLTG